MPITKEQARILARSFLELSHELGSYRFANWNRLTSSQRQRIENLEWDALNFSSSLVTMAVGIALDNLQDDLQKIVQSIAQARKTVATIREVKGILQIAAGVVTLGGALLSRNPAAIMQSAEDLGKSCQKVLAKD